jgi:tripartite-type tricarboxylate transporter receptor subunit TctC
VSIRERRKSGAGTVPVVSKIPRTQRRAVEAAPHDHPFRVNTANLPRRRFLHLSAGAAVLPAVSRIARAQTYPSRPIHLVVPYPPGGTDIIARLMGQWLSERLGQPFIIENRPGGNSNIATEAVVRAPPDGYTLLVVDSAPAINATYYSKLTFDFIRDIAPVASIVSQPGIMEVNPSVPAKTVPEFIAYAKANPGKLNMASGGIGNISHVSGELFKMMTGVNMVHVPYRGTAPAVSDLLGGQVQVCFAGIISSVEYIRAGHLRALAVTTSSRSEALPDIPSLSEFVPGYEAADWKGMVAPKNTPPEIIDKLNKEINAGLADPKLRVRFAELGSPVFPGSPADFGQFIAQDTEKWAKVVKFAGIKAD